MMFKKISVLVSAQHALMLAYRAEIYLWVLAHVLPFIMMGIWTKASANGGHFAMSPVEYAQYFLAVFVVRQFSAVWMIFEFEWHILEGRLSYLLLRPLNPLWHYVSGHFGEQLARFPFFIIVVILFFVLYPQAFWIPSLSAFIVGILAIYMAFALRFVMQYCFAMLTFWFERASSIDQLTFLPYLFLSGLVIPLADLPPQVAEIVRWTPFPYLIDFPATLFTGKLKISDPAFFQGLAIMAGWFILLWAIGSFLWKRGLYRYSGQGA